MHNDLTKVIVKVGESSDISFRKVRAFRALTVSELDRLSNVNTDARIVIIEHIESNEISEIKEFIQNFTSRGKEYRIYFYVKDNDDLTCGVADELTYDIYLNLLDIQKVINKDYNISIGTNINLIQNEMNQIDSSDELFGDLSKIEKQPNKQIEQQSTEQKGQSENNINIEETDHTTKQVIETTPETHKTHEDATDIQDNTVAEFNQQLSNLESERDKLYEKISSLSNEIDKLLKIQSAIEDERDIYKNILLGIENDTEVFEEPIDISEYTKLKEQYASLEKEITEYKSKVQTLEETNTVDKVTNEQLESLKLELNELKSKKEEIETALKAANSNIETLNEQNSNLSSKITEQADKLLEYESANETIETLKNKISELTEYIENLEKEFNGTKESLRLETIGRLKLMKLLANAVIELDNGQKDVLEKISEISKLNTVIENLRYSESNIREKLQQSEEKISELMILSADIDKKVDLAKSFVQQELDKVRLENIGLSSQLEVFKSQLIAKEEQYNNLVRISGVDENGANTLAETNKSLEVYNKSLRDRIVMLERELEDAKKAKIEYMKSVKSLEDTNTQLRSSVRAMSAGVAGGMALNLPPINYQGKGMIIPVFGSGSYGITTTAMSIAGKLALQSKVLYIDFDLVAAKADAWFVTNPIIKLPGVNPSPKCTGIGLLVDYGVQYILENANRVIMPVKKTKGGCIDYISGVYTKLDTVKLISADFSSFLTYCGNNYTYVVIDFGRLGTSELNDKIIKIFTDVAFRSILVTPNNKFDIRTMRLKLNEAKISIGNVAWLLNMCKSTVIDGDTKTKLEPSHCYGMVTFSEEIFGQLEDFSQNKLTRDKLGKFLDDLLRS